VLGQIDPGVGEERIVECLDRGYTGGKADWSAAPLSYWRQWREEIDLADVVVTNSSWTSGMLAGEGISEDKLRVIPLAYEQPAASTNFKRSYPFRFDHDRPLRVLFLGQINLRKGVGPLFDAIRLLDGEPIEFWFVGPLQVPMPVDLAGHRQIRWFGAVERGRTEDFYRDADVFLFPTFSDGFGLTQLEAQAWRLPVIASRFCGNVVKDGVNGVLLSEIEAACIATSLRAFVGAPALLQALSSSSGIERRFSVDSLAEQFLSL
jgi:glycosyltransferase involved in cell wall biosynthesis